jgi:hypothetical protein
MLKKKSEICIFDVSVSNASYKCIKCKLSVNEGRDRRKGGETANMVCRLKLNQGDRRGTYIRIFKSY